MLDSQTKATIVVALEMPDGPGWWAFEGSEWQSEPIYRVEGVEYRGWQKEWTEEAEEYWHRHELNLHDPIRYEPVKGEPFQTVVEVRWINKGQAISNRKHAGPHEGEPVLGFLSPKYRWNHALYSIDTWVGKWYKLAMPWEVALNQPAATAQGAMAVPDADWETIEGVNHWDDEGKVHIVIVHGIDKRVHVALDDGTQKITCVWPRRWRIQRQRPPRVEP